MRNLKLSAEGHENSNESLKLIEKIELPLELKDLKKCLPKSQYKIESEGEIKEDE